MAIHGRPRATKDLDIWVEASAEDAHRVLSALRAFGATLGDLEADDLEQPGTGFMMGRPPKRIDVLTEISGVQFAEAWPRRLETEFGGLRVPVIGLHDLLANKRAAGRAQDLADLEKLDVDESD